MTRAGPPMHNIDPLLGAVRHKYHFEPDRGPGGAIHTQQAF